MRHKNIWFLVVIFLSGFLNGCANLNYGKPLIASSKILQDKAYIYGRFILDRDFANMRKLSLQIEKVDTGKVTSFVFSDKNPVFALEVDPGNYRLKGISFAPLGAMMDFEITKIELPPEPEYLQRRITVAAAKCYYLGDFFGVSRRDNLASFIGSAIGTMAARDVLKGKEEERMQIVELNLQYGVVAVKQEFELTTEELKKSLSKMSQLTFEKAFKEK